MTRGRLIYKNGHKVTAGKKSDVALNSLDAFSLAEDAKVLNIEYSQQFLNQNRALKRALIAEGIYPKNTNDKAMGNNESCC